MTSRGAFFTMLAWDAGDFNGDGRSDVLWRDRAGTVTTWLGEANESFTGYFERASASAELKWRPGAIGDFTGDGLDDVLWWTGPATGIVTNWLSTATGRLRWRLRQCRDHQHPRFWFMMGSGDFNGDGRDDVLWRDLNGTVTNWLGQADGSFVGNFENAAASATLDWGFAGTGDFNGDGRDDILWHDIYGAVTEWLGTESGGFIGNLAAAYTPAPRIWSVAGTGDFNGDGRTDILWQTPNGDVTNWLAQADGGWVGNYDNAARSIGRDWEVVGIGDYNGDGYDDILWKKPGQVTSWLGQANGGFEVSEAPVLNVGFEWQVQPNPDLFG